MKLLSAALVLVALSIVASGLWNSAQANRANCIQEDAVSVAADEATTAALKASDNVFGTSDRTGPVVTYSCKAKADLWPF